MNNTESTKKLKFSEARITKIQEKINKLADSLEEKLNGDFTRKQKAKFKKQYKDKVKQYKSIIQENKSVIRVCKKELKPKKQTQEKVIIPVNMSAELPLIKENLLKSIKGLEATNSGTFTYNNIEYAIENVEYKNKRTGAKVIFKPMKILDNSITLSTGENVEDYVSPVACTLHKGYYVVKEDGFNHVEHRMSAEEEREKRKLYNNFYYRNKRLIQRKAQKEQLVKVCKDCGKEFTTDNKLLVRCEKCHEAHKNKVAPTFTRVCTVCGKEFTTTYSSKITCSVKCREKRRNMMYNPQLYKTYTKKCVICGKEFTTNRKNGKYCSKKCREHSRVDYYKEYYKKYYTNLEQK